ncbi:MAG: hydrogenase maturation nickel metallochaperone HypA [Bacteroidia bacterium]|nr:MAG: hydrogenase maturation nickel metallochaperone HypA [Bacteroidia bacterium]
MHEFSLACEVIKLAEYEAEKNKARSVNEITVEIGNFSGVEAEAFGSALSLLAEGSILEKARLSIIRTMGKGVCPACRKEFEMEQRFDTCPVCNSFPSEIKGGSEFRVMSLMIEEE